MQLHVVSLPTRNDCSTQRSLQLFAPLHLFTYVKINVLISINDVN